MPPDLARRFDHRSVTTKDCSMRKTVFWTLVVLTNIGCSAVSPQPARYRDLVRATALLGVSGPPTVRSCIVELVARGKDPARDLGSELRAVAFTLEPGKAEIGETRGRLWFTYKRGEVRVEGWADFQREGQDWVLVDLILGLVS